MKSFIPKQANVPYRGAWRAEFQLNTLTDRVWVKLPFSSKEIVLIPGELKLDNTDVDWRWSEDRKNLEFFVVKSGKHILKLQFQPQSRESRQVDLEIRIPVTPRNEFTIHASGNAQLSSLIPGEWKWDVGKSTLHGTTGPQSQIMIDYLMSDGDSTNAPQIEFEVLQWLKLRPGVAQLDVRIPARIVNWQLRKLELDVDPQLTLIAANSSQANPLNFKQNGRAVQIDFQRALTERVTLDLSFLIKDYESQEEQTLPRVNVKGYEEAKTAWLFCTVEKGVKFDELARKDLNAVNWDEVSRLWEDDVPAPRYTFKFRNRPTSGDLRRAWNLPRSERLRLILISRPKYRRQNGIALQSCESTTVRSGPCRA